MSCFATRLDSGLKMHVNNVTSPPPEMSRAQGANKRGHSSKLPCMSSFLLLKRQRMNTTTSTNDAQQNVPLLQIDESSYSAQKKVVESVKGHLSSEESGRSCFASSYESRQDDSAHVTPCGGNSGMDSPIFFQEPFSKAYTVLGERLESYVEEMPSQLGYPNEGSQDKIWTEAKDCSLNVPKETKLLSNMKLSEVLSPIVNDSFTGSGFDGEQQHGKFGQEMAVSALPSSYSTTESSLGQELGGSWNLMSNLASQNGHGLESVSPVIPYHLSPSSTEFIAYNFDNGFSLSNACLDEEIKHASETRTHVHMMTSNSNSICSNSSNSSSSSSSSSSSNSRNSSNSLICQAQQDRQGGAYFHGYLVPPDKSHNVLEGSLDVNPHSNNFLSTSESSSSQLSVADGSVIATPPEHADFVPDLWWPRVDHLHKEVLIDETADLNCDVNNHVASPRGITSPSGSLSHDVSKDVRDCPKGDDVIIAGDPHKCKNRKTELSYIALISKAILSSPEQRMLLSEIYDFLSHNYKDIKNNEKAWRNSVRHNLSLNECFVKQERLGRGRGHYWSIHPACVADFIKGDFRRRQARRRAKKSSLSNGNEVVPPPPPPPSSLPPLAPLAPLPPSSILPPHNGSLALPLRLSSATPHLDRINLPVADNFNNGPSISGGVSQTDMTSFGHMVCPSVLQE